MNKENVSVPLGLKNIKDVRELSTFKKEDEFPYNGLWLFTGAQGNGKTLLLMHVLREMHKEYPEAIIVSNIAIYGVPSFSYKGIDDFERYSNGHKGVIFVIDEIHTLFNSLESEKMPLSTVQVWSQNRKNRRVILGTSQRFNRVAKAIREQTKLLYVCYSPIFCFRRYACFDATMFDDQGNYTGTSERKHFYVPQFNVMTSYNTLEVVKRSTGYSRPKDSLSLIEEYKNYIQELQKNDSNF
jgi:hypothetical protein